MAAAALKFYGLEVFDESRLKVPLIEAGPRILPALPEPLAQAAHEQRRHQGKKLGHDQRSPDPDGVHVQ